MEHEETPFYGKEIFRKREQEYIRDFMKKYKNEPVNEELKKKVWNDLQMEKFHGRITIPFKVTMRKDPYNKFPSCIEVILDTKV